MESSKMICSGCDNDAFEEEDGFFYCLQCGVRADDIIATAVDDEDLAGDARGGATYSQLNTRRITTQPTAPPSHPEETNQYSQFRSQLKSAASKISQPNDLGGPTDPEDFGGEEAAVAALSYEDCYQQTRERYANGLIMMITYQCDALVEKFNVTPLIIGLVAPICLRFLALSGAFDQDWADNAIRDSELQSQETNGEVREVKKRRSNKGDSQHRSFDGKRAVMIWLSQLKSSLPLSSSLAISFLACHKAGAPVLPTDIVRWAREGKLPYQSCFLKIQELMGERTAACPVGARVMFSPDEIVSAQNLEAQAASIADVIGLVLPPVNFHGIALNYLERLSVPVDKVIDLVRLWAMPSEIYLSKSQHRLPTRVCVMSILVVAIRMLYNINGFGMWEKSLGDDDDDAASEESGDDGELVQVKKVATEFDTEELMKTLETKYYELEAETTADFENDLCSYLSHGKNEIFAGLEAASADDTYRTVGKLWNSYQKESEGVETPSKSGEKTPREPSLECSPSRDDDNQEDGRSKERAISRLIADMGENYFVYIPPRVKVKRQGYIQYVRKKDDGALVYAVHADYYILLRVCARVAEIDARNMHRGVLSFERRLAWIEKRIDHVLHLTPTSTSMKCKHCEYSNADSEDQDDDMV
ncbi:TATA box-binding protein-associated factor RNA polymerase I subunit B [Raphanus sativus]|uniref:TATA box-binding protein-associated factor RNA polymerase I subunit B n=1 Tax=Raphanus sativus TaxID=3726 RepID=A0A6J0LVL9_RAPSA|nr:TATA box-binding protein-associated factor RNA polymerase I subunit B [Raphanus sativus]